MATSFSKGRLRPTALSVCISTALSLGACAHAVAGIVTNCNDSGSGSFRQQMSAAIGSDVVDLSGLTCSLITLTSGEVTTSAQNLQVHGSDNHRVVIDAGFNSRVIHHSGFGNLLIDNLTITNGKYQVSGNASGGCISSSGKVELNTVLLSNCHAKSTGSGDAKGGGLYASQGAALFSSTVTDSVAVSDNADARGGGVYSGFYLRTQDVTLSGNQAAGETSLGGGAFSLGNALLQQTTVSANSADRGGGLVLHFGPQPSPSVIASQITVSGNSATTSIGGIYSRAPLILQNSTVTKNTEAVPAGAGVYLEGASQLDSTIVSGNGTVAGHVDIGGSSGASIAGSHNLTGAPSVVFTTFPSDTIIAHDPDLRPLADNGGRTRTHLPNGATSMTVGRGHEVGTLTWDQRGPGFPRSIDGAIDIGAVEYNSDILFISGFE